MYGELSYLLLLLLLYNRGRFKMNWILQDVMLCSNNKMVKIKKIKKFLNLELITFLGVALGIPVLS